MQAAPAKPEPVLLTDWIPCTTPPVREGVYDFQYIGGLGFGPYPVRGMFKDGKWLGYDDRHTKHGETLDRLQGLNESPAEYQWRGGRRWVLQGPVANMLSLIARETVYIYLEDARPRSAKWNSLAKARPFLTEAAAQRFATRYPRLGLTAVLP
jgi:hypothetical protein